MKRFFLFLAILSLLLLLGGCYTHMEIQDKTNYEATVVDSEQTAFSYTPLLLHDEWYPSPYYPYGWQANSWYWHDQFFWDHPWYHQGLTLRFYWDTQRFEFWNPYPWFMKPIPPRWIRQTERPKLPEIFHPRTRSNTNERITTDRNKENTGRTREIKKDEQKQNPPRERIQNDQKKEQQTIKTRKAGITEKRETQTRKNNATIRQNTSRQKTNRK